MAPSGRGQVTGLLPRAKAPRPKAPNARFFVFGASHPIAVASQRDPLTLNPFRSFWFGAHTLPQACLSSSFNSNHPLFPSPFPRAFLIFFGSPPFHLFPIPPSSLSLLYLTLSHLFLHAIPSPTLFALELAFVPRRISPFSTQSRPSIPSSRIASASSIRYVSSVTDSRLPPSATLLGTGLAHSARIFQSSPTHRVSSGNHRERPHQST